MAGLPFFAATPVNSPRVQYNAGSAINQLTSFNNAYNQAQAAFDSGSGFASLTQAEVARWYSAAREGIVNIGGKPVDYEFFYKLFGGKTKEIETEATDLWVEYNGAIDFNIYPQSDASGTGAGGSVTFTLATNCYSPDGTEVNVTVGTRLYNHTDMKTLIVSAVSYVAPFNTSVTAYATDSSYNPQVYAGLALTTVQVQTDHGFTQFENESAPWETPGYLKLVQPWQLSTNWSIPYDLMSPYQQIMRFAVWMDPMTNQEIDTYDLKEMQTKRELFQMAKNTIFWAGQKDTNQANLASASVQTYYNKKYGGFDGFIPSIMYGGGQVRPYNNSIGWSYDTDGTEIILELDALKLANEYLILQGLGFDIAAQKNAQIVWQDTSGSLNMKTFERMGGDSEGIKRLGIQSWTNYGTTFHKKIVGSLSDSRYFGHGYYPYMGIMMPGYGMTDSKGMEVPPVEFFRAKGAPMSGTYREDIVDLRTNSENMKSQFNCGITETVQMNVNGVENMYLLLPQYPTA